ncbi:MAG: pitrilysin family protein [Acidobacteriota bacterium]
MRGRAITGAAGIMITVVTMSGCASGARQAASSPVNGRPPIAVPAAVTAPQTGPVLLAVPADPTVSFAVVFATGSQNDPADKAGLACLTAMLMAEGATEKHAYNEILQLLFPIAAGYNLRVDKEQITFTGRVHRDNLDLYASLLLDAVLRPAFAEADFERIRQRTIDGIEKTLRYSSDEELGKAALSTAVFAGTAYGHLNQGSAASLRSITLADVRAFYRANFTRDNVTLGVGGGFTPELVTRVQQALTALPAGAPAALAPPRPSLPPGRSVLIVEKPGPATAISFGFPLPVLRGEREFYALWLANSWLGEHRNSSSHLYQVIREMRGMNYGDYSYLEHFPEAGMRTMPPPLAPRRAQLFEVWIRPVPNAQAHFALRAALRELEALVANGLTEEQLELTRSFLSKYCLHFAETTQIRLGYALDDRFYGIAPEGHLARFRATIANLTRDEVNIAIRKYLKPENLVIAMVTADGGALVSALAGEAPSPISYATPKPAEVLAEDKLIEAYPLGIRREAIRIVPVDEMFAK